MRKVNSCKRTLISLNRNKGTKDGTYILSDIIIGQPLSSFRIPSTNHIRQQILFLNRVRTSVRYNYSTSLKWVSGLRKKRDILFLAKSVIYLISSAYFAEAPGINACTTLGRLDLAKHSLRNSLIASPNFGWPSA